MYSCPCGGEELVHPLQQLPDRRQVEVEPRSSLERRDAFGLLLGGQRLVLLGGAPEHEQMDELHVAHVDESARQRIQIHAPYLDMVHALLRKRQQIVQAARLEAHGIVELARCDEQSVLDVPRNAFRVGPRARGRSCLRTRRAAVWVHERQAWRPASAEP